jgi:glycosyltransferase involved in cell wall biosynthesis
VSAARSPLTRVAVIVSTYEWPEALEVVLRAFDDQSDTDFELVVADDGSSPATRSVVDGWRASGDRLVHVRQPDEGFRLARVLNLGALATNAHYLVFVHGESIPRPHFTRALRMCAIPGWFAAGRRVDLSEHLTTRVLAEHLPVHRWGMWEWLRHRGDARPLLSLTRRDRRRVGADRQPEFVPRDRAYGYLLGVAREHFEQVNGYDMRFEGWGEEDVDIAVRLRRTGLRCGHPGPDATLLHLAHTTNMSARRPNWDLLQETEQSDRTEAVEGLRELAAGLTTPGGSRGARTDLDGA